MEIIKIAANTILLPGYIILMTIIFRRYYRPWYNSESYSNSGSPYRLARIISRILGWVHDLSAFFVMLGIFVYMAGIINSADVLLFDVPSIDTWIKLDLSMVPSLEISGLQNQTFYGKAILDIIPPHPAFKHLTALSKIFNYTILCFLLTQLRKVFISTSNGEAFTTLNASRLTKIALIIIAWDLSTRLVNYLMATLMLNQISANSDAINISPFPDINPVPVFTGFALLVLAGVLKEAVTIKEEHRLTI